MYQQMPAAVLVLNNKTKRESGRKVQLNNINAAKNISDVVRTCLGPQAMLKMLMDPMGGIVITNDGNAILREITVQHPAAKSMIEIARTQDEEVGDGTTSVIVLAGELLSQAEQFLSQNIHPTVVIAGYRRAMEDMINYLNDKVAVTIDVKDDNEVTKVVKSCIGTKFLHKWSELACEIAVKAVRTVSLEENGRKEVDIKRYARVEKLPGGAIEDSCILDGVMLNKDVLHPKMNRRLENPRIILLDCNLEYKKGESQIEMELSKEDDFTKALKAEEEFIQKECAEIIRFKPDLVITEKGISDSAIHYLLQAGISAIRRVKKSDNNRVARAVGAQIVHRPSEIREEDVGTGCGLMEIREIGEEFFCFLTKCRNPKACTMMLRGASKDILNEVERNLQDALHTAKNVVMEPKLAPGGGATEMALAQYLHEKAKAIQGVEQYPYLAVARAMEVIPRTLIQNCGANVIRTLTALRAKHATAGNSTFGIDGSTGTIVDMKEFGIWEPLMVKMQVIKSAIESAVLLLRIDDLVSGTKKQADIDNPAMQMKKEAEENPEPAGPE